MTSDDPLRDETRRAAQARKNFKRRREAALAGLHLPTEHELIAGMPFLWNDIQRDMQAFAERVVPRLRRKPDEASLAGVADRLEELTVCAGLDEVIALTDQMSAAVASGALTPDAAPWRLRCRIYRAHLGDHRVTADLARDALMIALRLEDGDPDVEVMATDMIRAALGWLSVAAFNKGLVPYPATTAARNGRRLADLLRREVPDRSPDGKAGASVQGAMSGIDPGTTCAKPGKGRDAPPVLAAVVIKDIGNSNTGEGRKVAKEFDALLGKALPLVPMPELDKARTALRAEFPYAEETIDRILGDIPVRAHVQLRPTILVGSPGCGKSRFARRLLTVLGLPHDLISCGGIADGAFAGTPRRWSSGEPSLALALIIRFRNAGPGAVLDEIEKVGSSRHNGQAHDALLGFLERETACRFHDPYIQAPCDVSHITWLMTANSLDGLSPPLRDRCRIIQFPEPRREHIPVLGSRIITDIVAEQGLDHRWASPLDQIETEAVSSAWSGGSLRVLRRMIEVVLACRNVKH